MTIDRMLVGWQDSDPSCIRTTAVDEASNESGTEQVSY